MANFDDLKKVKAYCVIQRELGRLMGIAYGVQPSVENAIRVAVQKIDQALVDMEVELEDAAD